MKQTRVAIYTRVSTQDQSNEGQQHELRQYAKRRGWAVTRVYADKISGLKSTRPALDQLLHDAKTGKFDCTLVWRIDRLGRSVTHLLEVLETLRGLHVEFVSLSEAIDTTSPAGLLVFTVLAAVAALERSILVERIRLGLDNAKRRGVRLGRPALKNLDAAEISKIRAERRKGGTLRAIAKAHGTSLWSVHRLCSS
jgi:DNA invertase Pin-like site-specific DNA recombinase